MRIYQNSFSLNIKQYLKHTNLKSNTLQENFGEMQVDRMIFYFFF